MTKGDGMLLVGVVASIGLLGLLFFVAPKADETPYGPVEVTGSSIDVSSPETYRVDAWVSLNQPGFITVHESVGGAPGPVLATSTYMDTTAVVTSIAVDPEMTSGAEYVALLHVDNGDKQFSMYDDLPVMSEGNVVKATFRAATPVTE